MKTPKKSGKSKKVRETHERMNVENSASQWRNNRKGKGPGQGYASGKYRSQPRSVEKHYWRK